MSDLGGGDGSYGMGTDGAESMGVARARQSEQRAAAALPRHDAVSRVVGACSVRSLLIVIGLVILAAWLLTALNAGA